MKTDTPVTIYLKNYQQPDFEVESLDLHFSLDPEATIVTATSRYHKTNNSQAELKLDGQKLELVSVKIDGNVLRDSDYSVTDDHLVLADVPDSFELEIQTRINPAANTALEGLYRSSNIFCTQCEAEGFRKITYFLDRPDVMTTYTTTIEADRDLCPVMLSNGNLVERGELENNRHWAKWQDPHKKPCYLFALVAGDLEYIQDTYLTSEGRKVDLRIHVEKENIDKCEHAMRSLINAMRWDEVTFGLAYDLDIYMIVAVNDFNMGAMENKGLNVFNSKYVLALPETATDDDFEGIESVIGHEYFHNWTGNRITCRDWFQLSLKEGLTVYRDQEFSADMNSRAVKRIQDVRVLRAAQFPEDAGPMAHPVRPDSYSEINNFYTATVYNKGAEVVRMYETFLGKDGFRKGMDLYFERHDGQAVTTDDFLACMRDANNAELPNFERWYQQSGTPVVDVELEYDADSAQCYIRFKQSCPPTPGQDSKQPFLIPLEFGMLSEAGDVIPVHIDGEEPVDSCVVALTDSEHEIVCASIPGRPVLSLNRSFKSPIKVNYDYSDGELAVLMSHDPDLFNRWEASQLLATRLMLAMVAQHQAGEEFTVPDSYIGSIRELIASSDDKALLAEALVLPGEAYMAEQMAVIDVDAIHLSREFLYTEIARQLEQEIVELYNGNHDPAGRLDADSIAARSLKNIALHYLVRLDKDEYYKLAVAQFSEARVMSDEIAALDALVNSHSEHRGESLQAFFEKWQGDKLVLDKWFSLQARSRMPDTLQVVELLLDHAEFDLKNPNKVRALVGSFSHGNPRHFHNEDGSGYQLLADLILKLDPMNPQVAARLLGAFARWRRYNDKRQSLMKAQLERIAATEGLSQDCLEIASKSLA